MNFRCSICDAVLSRRNLGERCPECGARAVFQQPTSESPRHARSVGADVHLGWEIGPEGPRLVRLP